jgi:hypothetical protein
MLKDKILSLILTAVMVLGSTGFAFADQTTNPPSSSGYIWDQRTGVSTPYNISKFKNTVSTTTPAEVLDQIQNTTTPDSSGSSTDIHVSAIAMPVFDHYSETSSIVNYKLKYVGVTRVDNSGNKYSSASLIYTATVSSSWSISGTTGAEVQAELTAIVAKVKVSSSVSGTASRSWSKGTTYGTSTTVPAGKIGKVEAYIPGTTSKGNAVYKVYNTSDSTYYYENRSRGAVVPSSSGWNFVVTVPCA